jgi:hypothetical protein
MMPVILVNKVVGKKKEENLRPLRKRLKDIVCDLQFRNLEK